MMKAKKWVLCLAVVFCLCALSLSAYAQEFADFSEPVTGDITLVKTAEDVEQEGVDGKEAELPKKSGKPLPKAVSSKTLPLEEFDENKFIVTVKKKAKKDRYISEKSGVFGLRQGSERKAFLDKTVVEEKLEPLQAPVFEKEVKGVIEEKLGRILSQENVKPVRAFSAAPELVHASLAEPKSLKATHVSKSVDFIQTPMLLRAEQPDHIPPSVTNENLVEPNAVREIQKPTKIVEESEEFTTVVSVGAAGDLVKAVRTYLDGTIEKFSDLTKELEKVETCDAGACETEEKEVLIEPFHVQLASQKVEQDLPDGSKINETYVILGKVLQKSNSDGTVENFYYTKDAKVGVTVDGDGEILQMDVAIILEDGEMYEVSFDDVESFQGFNFERAISETLKRLVEEEVDIPSVEKVIHEGGRPMCTADMPASYCSSVETITFISPGATYIVSGVYSWGHQRDGKFDITGFKEFLWDQSVDLPERLEEPDVDEVKRDLAHRKMLMKAADLMGVDAGEVQLIEDDE